MNPDSTWLPLPPDRRGAKCPVSGFCRRKLQQLIYGIPSKGIPPKVQYRFIPGGPNNKERIFINRASLMQHLFGESEVSEQTLKGIEVLAQSPEWCRTAFNSLVLLTRDRAGLTTADFLQFLAVQNGLQPNPIGPLADVRRNAVPVSLQPKKAPTRRGRPPRKVMDPA